MLTNSSSNSQAYCKRLQVPKQFHGKVIGKRAATKLDIESDYGVTITMPDRNNAEDETIIIHGPTQTSVDAAENRILDICGMASSSSDAAREQITRLMRKRDEAFSEAKQMPNGPQRDAAYARANALKEEVEREQQALAQKIFNEKNLGYGLDQMDLHGLSVKEAEHFVNQRLDKVQSKFTTNNGFVLSIITGFGHHSDNNVAKIKPAIMDLLNKRGFRHHLDHTQGVILVDGLVTDDGPVPTQTRPVSPPPSKKHKTQEPEHSSSGNGLLLAIGLAIGLFTCCFRATSTRTSTKKKH